MKNSRHPLTHAKFFSMLLVICALACAFAAPNFGVKAEDNTATPGALPSPSPTPTPGKAAIIVFDPPSPSVLPGQRISVRASVTDSKNRVRNNDVIESAKPAPGYEDYAQVNLRTDENGKKVIDIVGLSGPSGASSTARTVPVIVTANTGAADNLVSVLNVQIGTTLPQPGAIPTASPEVDVMWAVLPKKIVRDNFGSRVADEYFGIGIVIGNNSGYALQIASVGFTVPNLRRPGGTTNYTIPAAGYLATRGTITRQQQAGVRTELMNGINGTSGVLTGLVPFFHVLNHKSNYTQFVNVFSSPLTALFNLVVPDLTTGDLNRLDQQALRNDNQNVRTIIENNTQYATITFFPKKFLDNDLKRVCAGRGSSGLKPTNGSENYTPPCSKWQDLREDPQAVMQSLGDIVLIGQQVQFVNRIRLNGLGVSTSGTGQFAISGRVTDTCGQGVAGVTVKLSGGANLSQNATTDVNGNYVFSGVPSGNYVVTPQTGGNVTFPGVAPISLTLASDQGGIDFNATLTDFVIKGRVVDAITGAPVQGITVSLSGGATAQKTTGADGSYSFSGLAAGASYTVSAANNSTFNIENPTSQTFQIIASNCHQINAVDFRARRP